MHIRPLEVDNHPWTTDLLTETFRAFFEGYAHPHLGEQVFQHQHGHWEQDYRDELPTLHAPEAGRHAAVATLAEGTIVGLISWRVDTTARHGEIYLLAVSPLHQRHHIGHAQSPTTVLPIALLFRLFRLHWKLTLQASLEAHGDPRW